jgi:hypothetical protein
MAAVRSRLYLNFILKILHRQLHQIKLGVQFKFSKCYLLLLETSRNCELSRKTCNSFKPYVQYIQTYNDLSLYVIVIKVMRPVGNCSNDRLGKWCTYYFLVL